MSLYRYACIPAYTCTYPCLYDTSKGPCNTHTHCFADNARSAAAAVTEYTVRECKTRAGGPSKDAEERDEEEGGYGDARTRLCRGRSRLCCVEDPLSKRKPPSGGPWKGGAVTQPRCGGSAASAGVVKLLAKPQPVSTALSIG